MQADSTTLSASDAAQIIGLQENYIGTDPVYFQPLLNTGLIKITAPIIVKGVPIQHGITKLTPIPMEERECPHCKAMGLATIKEYKHIRLKHSPMVEGTHHSLLDVGVPYYECKCCGGKWLHNNTLMFNKHRVTLYLAKSILLELAKGATTDRNIALTLALSEHLVTAVINEFLTALLGDPKLVKEFRDHPEKCTLRVPDRIYGVWVDEVSIFGRYFCTLFRDVDGNLLYWCIGRDKATVKSFVEWADGHLESNLYVASDMNAPYEVAFKELLPNCVVTHDGFHVLKHLIDDVDHTIKSTANALAKEGNDDVDQLRNVDLMLAINTAPDKISQEKQALIDQVSELFPVLRHVRNAVVEMHLAYDPKNDRDTMAMHLHNAIWSGSLAALESIKQQPDKQKLPEVLRQHLLERYPDALKEHFPELLRKHFPELVEQKLPLHLAPAQVVTVLDDRRKRKVPPMAHSAAMWVSHFETILNYSITHMSTGPMEGFNNFFKALKHMKYGLKIMDRFMYRLLFINATGYIPSVTGPSAIKRILEGLKRLCVAFGAVV